MSPPTHPFLDLDESERVQWIARFLDEPGGDGPYELPFPVLRREEPPFAWLTDQFRRVRRVADRPDRVRRPVLALLLTGAGSQVRNRAQVLGELLEVVGGCELADREVVEALRGWVRADLYADSYQVRGNRRSVRAKVWSLLIGWHQTEGLVDALRRDFPRSQLDCAQLCFAELGRLAPADAIERIPAAFAWPEPYWREVLRGFFESLHPRQATAERYRLAWERCFAEVIWNPSKFTFVDPQGPAPFVRLLQEVGIRYQLTATVVRLRPDEPGALPLRIDVARFRRAASDDMVMAINQAMAAASAGYRAAAAP